MKCPEEFSQRPPNILIEGDLMFETVSVESFFSSEDPVPVSWLIKTQHTQNRNFGAIGTPSVAKPKKDLFQDMLQGIEQDFNLPRLKKNIRITNNNPSFVRLRWQFLPGGINFHLDSLLLLLLLLFKL